MGDEERTGRPPVFVHGDWVQVYVDPDPAGGPGFVRIEERSGAPGVAVLPLFGGRVGLVRVFRRLFGDHALEIPRGFGGESGSTKADAVREFWEETGLTIGEDSLVELGHVRANSGLLATGVALFLVEVEDHRERVTIPDADEIAGFAWYDLDLVLRWVADDVIVDAFTCTALLRALTRDALPRMPTIICRDHRSSS